jgi:radical SAM superfamily enzyme YgiQ (UPF0313 family)
MKVCLINAPWEEDKKWGIRAGCRFPNLMLKRHNAYLPYPFLLAYTASFLESKGLDVLMIDGVAERCDLASFMNRVHAFAPDMVIAESSTPSLRFDLARMQEIKTANPGVFIVLYGPHMSVRPQDGLTTPAVDYVIVGEPEHTTYELIRALTNGGNLAEIDGLVYREANGNLRINPRRPLTDINQLPYPKRHGLPMDRYSVPGFPSPVVYMYGSRGCPFMCTYCLWPQTIYERGKYRARDAEKIVDEMEYVLKEFPQTRSFYFADDTFNLGRARMLKFAAEMKRRKLRFPYGIDGRADHLDRELLERMAETGLFTLRIGIESGDVNVLKKARKALNLEHTREVLQIAQDLGIRNHISLMIGLAEESWQSVENTIDYVKSLAIDSAQFSVATPFPGTEYYRYVEEQGLWKDRDWSKFSASDTAVMHTKYMTAEEVQKATNHARRKVYFSPRFIKKRLGYVRDVRDLIAITGKAWRLVIARG